MLTHDFVVSIHLIHMRKMFRIIVIGYLSASVSFPNLSFHFEALTLKLFLVIKQSIFWTFCEEILSHFIKGIKKKSFSSPIWNSDHYLNVKYYDPVLIFVDCYYRICLHITITKVPGSNVTNHYLTKSFVSTFCFIASWEE